MTSVLYRLGHVCVHRRWVVLAVWLTVFAGLAVAARSVGPNVNDNLTLPGTDSQKASDLLAARFPEQANGTNPVVMTAPAGAKLTDSRYQKPIDDAVSALRKDPDVREATSPLAQAGAAYLSKDKRIGYIALNLREPERPRHGRRGAHHRRGRPGPRRGPDGRRRRLPGPEGVQAGDALERGRRPDDGRPRPAVHVRDRRGHGPADRDRDRRPRDRPLAHHAARPGGRGPDRRADAGDDDRPRRRHRLRAVHRDAPPAQRRAGMPLDESIARSTATSGGAVLFAGTTVIVALLSLAVVDIPLVTTLGYTAALVVAVAVIAAVTLLPALLAIVGARIDALALPHRRTVKDDHPHGWERWARFVTRRPLPSALVALVVLVALALPVRDLYLGQQDNGALPTSTEARRAYDGLTAGFGVGANGPLLVSVDLSQKPAKADQEQLDKIDQQESDQKKQAQQKADAQEQQTAASLEAQGGRPGAGAGAGPAAARRAERSRSSSRPTTSASRPTSRRPTRASRPARRPEEDAGVDSVTQPLVNDPGTAAVMTATPTTAPSDRATERLVRRLRDDTIPAATKGRTCRRHRRHHRRLRRPRRRDLREALAHDRAWSWR